MRKTTARHVHRLFQRTVEEKTTCIQGWGNQNGSGLLNSPEAMIPVKKAFKILTENDIQPKILYFDN